MGVGQWTLYTVTTLDRLESGDLFKLLNSVNSSEINFIVGCRGFESEKLNSLGNYSIRGLDLPFRISLSAARNRLLSEFPPPANSAVAFPDDDSHYINGFSFSQAWILLQQHDFLIGSVIEDPMNMQNQCSAITKKNLDEVLKFVCSANIFIAPGKVTEFRFDQNLGLGTELKSGEDLDLFLWLFLNFKKGHYDKTFALIHSNKGKNLEYFNGGVAVLYKYRSEISGMRWSLLRRIIHGFVLMSNRQFDRRLFLHTLRKLLINGDF